MKNSVLILSNSLKGLYSFRKEVLKAIRDEGYDVVLSVPQADERAQYFESIGCSIVETELNRRGMNPISDFNLLVRYCKLIRKIKPITVLTYTIKPNVYGGLACRLTKTPQLANVTGLGDAMENGGWLQKLTMTLYKVGLSKTKKVFFQNTTNKEYFEKHGIVRGDTILLPGSGVNLAHHTFQAYPTDEGKVRFLFIGRLLKDKGVEELFDAAETIKSKYPNAEIQMLGPTGGSLQSRLDDLVDKGIVKHLGSTTDVRPYIGAVECTVMPSYHEGMSNVNLESEANGRPVITTNVPGCKETIDDGATGYLVEVKNGESLATAMEKFILLTYNEKVNMGHNARKKVEKEFDRQIVVEKYLSEINGIAHV